MKTRALLLVALAAACGDKDDADDDTALELPCTGASVVLTFPTQPLSGDVSFQVSLIHPGSEPASVAVQASADGTSYAAATLTGSTTGLASSPEGTVHTLVWDSAADLGLVNLDAASLKVIPTSACGNWSFAEQSLAVHNEEELPPTCDIAITTPTGPVDGQTVVQFTTTHPDSLPVDVKLEYSADGGDSWERASLVKGDCDGDGSTDGETALGTAPEGLVHCLTWDTEQEITTDLEAQLRVSCYNGSTSTFEDSADSDAFAVHNDRTPDAGELVVSEVLSYAKASKGDYIELYNRTNHVLNAEGVTLDVWSFGDTPDDDPVPYYSYTISTTAEVLLVDPGAHLLLAASKDEAANGCLTAELGWGEALSLRAVSTLRLSLADTPLAELRMLSSAGFPAESAGVAVGVSPAEADGASWDAAGSWCYQSSTVADCGAVNTKLLAKGTPGQANDTCE